MSEIEIKCCSKCGYFEHQEVLDKHHKDGNHKNNSLGNVVLLCPTCHAEHHRLKDGGNPMLNIQEDFINRKRVIEAIRCPLCNSTSTYARKRTKSHRCKVCGCEFNSKKTS